MMTAGVSSASISSIVNVSVADSWAWPGRLLWTLGFLLLDSWELRPVGSCELLAGRLLGSG